MKFDLWSAVAEYEVQGLYSGEWERITSEDTREAADAQRHCYNKNEPEVTHRVIRVTVAPEDIPGSEGKASVVRYNDICTVKEFMLDEILNTVRDSHYWKRGDVYYTQEFMTWDVSDYLYTVKVVYDEFMVYVSVARTYRGRIVDWVPWEDFDWYVRGAENAAQ